MNAKPGTERDRDEELECERARLLARFNLLGTITALPVIVYALYVGWRDVARFFGW